MNYRYQIQGRYFLVALFFLNIFAPLPVMLLLKDPTPHENAVIAGMWAYMLLNTAGMGWCLWTIMPKPLPSYNRFQNFLYRRRAGVKPWLHRAMIAVLIINLGLGIAIRFTHGRHGHLTGQATVDSWIIIGSATFVLLMKLWPLPPVKAGQ
jgi:hypothetical protein